MSAPSFLPIQLDPEISRGAIFGPSYSTVVWVTVSGTEQRVAQWSMGRYKGTISMEVLRRDNSVDKIAAMIAFFHSVMGRAFAFRFKDWNDYRATNEPLAPTGAATVQLIRTYTSGPVSYVRPIYAPVASPAVTLRKNGSSFLGFTLDTTTGLVTLTALNTKSITGISPASSAVVTVGAAHGFLVNDWIVFSGVVGTAGINGLVGLVTATALTTVTVAVNTTQMGAYVSGGTATKYLASTDAIDWSGTFDNVVRFDTDEMNLSLDEISYGSWTSVPILEVR